MRLLLLSNSTNPGGGYLAHAVDWLKEHLEGVRTIAFIPWAAVRFSWDEYEARVAAVMGALGVEVRSVHQDPSPARVVGTCDAVAVGGGNTFRLVDLLHREGLMEAVEARVREGAPFVGWSAGSNVACPTLRTTNDMPIVEPPSFSTLGLVPFQINPHYLDAHPDRHMGETREERILEFLALNPDVPVVGLREGSALRVADRRMDLLGERSARIFRAGLEPVEAGPVADLSSLLS